MSAKSASLEPQPCRQRNSGRREPHCRPARILHVRDLQRLAEPPWNHLRFAPDQTRSGAFGLLESWNHWSCARCISLMPPIYPFQRQLLPVTGEGLMLRRFCQRVRLFQ